MDIRISFFDKPCGVLTIEDERFAFRYLDLYVAESGPSISASMPVCHGAYPDSIVFPFFENLLPEGEIRALLAEGLKTSQNNFARLLSATGGDVAGALSMKAVITGIGTGNPVESTTTADCAPLSKAALGEVLKRIETTPFLATPGARMRLSLAGAQRKLPVILENDSISLPENRLSTHIVKPPSPRFEGLVENEYLCMRTARRAGLNVPDVTLVSFLTEDQQELDCYVVQRYDRRGAMTGTGAHAVRIHQEDLCQILSVTSSRKYVADGGPGYRELFDSVRRITRPAAIHQNELIRRVLFNLVLGNNDAHGKNFSFLHGTGNIALAPAYDLVCTAVYADLDQEFAMPFGGATRISELNGETLAQFAEETGVHLRRQSRELVNFLDKLLAAFTVEAAALTQESYPQTGRVIAAMDLLIRHNHARVRELFTSSSTAAVSKHG